MRTPSRKRANGRATSGLFVVGLLIALVVFLRGRSSSPTSTIKRVLTEAGYSDTIANIWIAVSKFETANFTSNLYKTNHNLFGMKQPRSRATVSLGGDKNGWANYATDEDSVRDLVLYMQEFDYPKISTALPGFDLSNWIKRMKDNGYFEEPYNEYLSGVERYYS